MNIDIQGAELLALKGASKTLDYIEAINTEVNYRELYEGCSTIDRVDAYLVEYVFRRVAAISPYHPSWGDAFYVKQSVITMSTLGTNGRFANQLFQYAFMKIYAKEHGLKVCTPPWIGRELFGASDDLCVGKIYPEVRQTTHVLEQDAIINANLTMNNVDLWGYFQYNTKYYAKEKDYFRSLFEPVEPLKARLCRAEAQIRSTGETLVALHLRRGDYGYAHFFVAPNQWYIDWLNSFWDTLNSPILYIASDEPDKVLSDFAAYNPKSARDLRLNIHGAPYYVDFYMLSRADFLAISNSSFSFAAAMLNRNAKGFFRPRLSKAKLIPFVPWGSEVIFRDEKIDEHPDCFSCA